MENRTMTNRHYGMLFIRVLLGIIFLMQGYGKVFNWGVNQVYQSAFAGLQERWIPDLLLKTTAYYTSFAELICGFLLILGLFRRPAYLILASVLLLVSYGHGLESPIWDLSHVFPRAVLLAALFLSPADWDVISLDKKLGLQKT